MPVLRWVNPPHEGSTQRACLRYRPGSVRTSARRLRTELEEAGTSFNHVLADYRSRLARRLLARTDESIEQIVYLTGFAEPSTFYRAFKRWTNETPIEYRRRKQEERAAR